MGQNLGPPMVDRSHCKKKAFPVWTIKHQEKYHILMYIIYKTHAWHLNDWIICILAVNVAKYIIHGWHGTGHPGDIFHVATVTCYIHLPACWPLGACAPLAAILGFKSSTFPSSDCCLANCLAFISSFRGIHGFLGTLHCFQLPSQPGQPARTGLSCHVEEHSFLGHLSIFQAFETRIQSENPIPNKLGIRGIWQTISQSNFVARSFLGRQLWWRWKHGCRSRSFLVFFSCSSPEACVVLWWRDGGWKPPTIPSSIATCPASGPFSACGLRWHCNMQWDV